MTVFNPFKVKKNKSGFFELSSTSFVMNVKEVFFDIHDKYKNPAPFIDKMHLYLTLWMSCDLFRLIAFIQTLFWRSVKITKFQCKTNPRWDYPLHYFAYINTVLAVFVPKLKVMLSNISYIVLLSTIPFLCLRNKCFVLLFSDNIYGRFNSNFLIFFTPQLMYVCSKVINVEWSLNI